MSYKYCLPFLFLACVGCKNGKETTETRDTAQVNGHPAWIQQNNIYEVNVRQYTPEGTFAAFAKHLDRLRQMGVGTLWFMPINPISKVERKGSLGSYYAVSDYTAVNPEFGSLDDWKALVKKAHEMGFKVMIDWVPNHTGADHYWLQKHPDFYVKDSTGKPVSQFDWTDTRKLNFANAELRDSMLAQMKFWVSETGIDGFRCDYAVGPSRSFWQHAIKELKGMKNLFMLAEADSTWLHEVGFDATYAWPEFAMMKLIAAGKRKAWALDSVVTRTDTSLPQNAIRLFFTSNHDENSWNQADFNTMPGESHTPFAVLSHTMKRSLPLIYSGQEEPVLRAISFFEKDSMNFSQYKRAPLYKQLLELRKNNPALAPNASFTKINTGNEDHVYAFSRRSGNHFVAVIVNLSQEPQMVDIKDINFLNGQFEGPFYQLDGTTQKKFPLQQKLDAWGYRVIYK